MRYQPALWPLLLCPACSGSDEPSQQVPKVKIQDDKTFLVLESATVDCSPGGAPSPGKLWPSQEALTIKLEEDAARFIVSLADDIDLETYPLPNERSSEGNALARARAEAIARTQACTIATVKRGGGKYVSSFFSINGLVAELTVEQALSLSALLDVAHIQLADDEDAPLP